jgi:Holliday junction resolvase RusA-like endonuclease
MNIDIASLESAQEYYIPVPPVPASRPKVARFGTYYSKRHQQYVKDFATCLHHYPPEWEYLDKEARLIVGLEFVCTRPKRVTNAAPHYDIDNLSKLPLDCMTSADIFWHDDRQIELLIAHKRYAKVNEEPHTLVRVYAI